MRVLSRRLAASAATTLSNRTARGDHRENLVYELLRTRLGSSFAGTKGEIIDSAGRSTGEFDVVVYDRRVGSCVDEEGGRHLVRVESVAATIEIKSDLDGSHLDELFAHSNKELIQLTRFYRATHLLKLIGRVDAARLSASLQKLQEDVCAMSHYESIPAIPSFVFAYDGLTVETAARHLNEFCPNVVCVLGKYTAGVEKVGFPDNPAKLAMYGEGDDALGAFLFLLEESMHNFLEGRKYAVPAWRRYFWSPEVLEREDAGA